MRPMKALLTAVVVALASLVGATWYLSHRIHGNAFLPSPGGNEPLDLKVVSLAGGAVHLRPTNRAAAASLRQSGRFGLQYEGGYGQVSGLRAASGDNSFQGRFEHLAGAAPAPGAAARLDSFAFVGDPGAARQLEWEPVEVDTPVGPAPAWLIPDDPVRWALFVHGKGARPEEVLRVLPVLHEAGWTSLVISYRNDPGCAEDGCYAYGASEWEDLEAAARFAVNRGARDLLLVGYSMGGAITLSFLNRSPLADSVRGLVLDSPMTDLRMLLHLRARAARIPRPLIAPATRRALRRTGLAWDQVDYHTSFAHADLPVLLFHGDRDATIPVALSDAFAAKRPNITYHRVPGAGHVRSWNTDPDRYESAVRDFLARVPNTAASTSHQSAGR
jgi:hypothetical protein